jgi:hypothetical protein
MSENTENTPKSKEEMDKALEDLQLDPEDLDAVSGGTCDTCYSHYSPELTESGS